MADDNPEDEDSHEDLDEEKPKGPIKSSKDNKSGKVPRLANVVPQQ